jgi:hypothetical protein
MAANSPSIIVEPPYHPRRQLWNFSSHERAPSSALAFFHLPAANLFASI